MAQMKSYGGGGGKIIRKLLTAEDGTISLGEVVLYCIGMASEWVGIENTSFDPDANPPVISFTHNRTCDIMMLNFINNYSPGINPVAESDDPWEEYKTEDGLKFGGDKAGGSTGNKVAVLYFGAGSGSGGGNLKENKRLVVAGIGTVTKTGKIDTGSMKMNKNTTEVQFEAPSAEIESSVAE